MRRLHHWWRYRYLPWLDGWTDTIIIVSFVLIVVAWAFVGNAPG